MFDQAFGLMGVVVCGHATRSLSVVYADCPHRLMLSMGNK